MSVDDLISVNIPEVDQRVRKRSLTYAFLAGIISKLLAIAVQWIALPLSLRALGTDRYAAFLALMALVAWSGLLTAGLAPSLPRAISEAFVAHARKVQQNIFQTAIVFLLAVSALFAALMFGAEVFVSPSQIIAVHRVPPGEVNTAYKILILVTCVQLFGSLMPSIRSGYQELHYSYLWAALANVLVIAGLLHFASSSPTISTFLAVIYSPLALLAVADMALICLQRPYLLQGGALFAETAKALAPQASNAMAAQFAYFLVSFLPILIVAHMTDSSQTAIFGSIMQLFALAVSGMNLIFQPLVPAIANASAHHDRTWVRNAYFRAAALVGTICFIGLMIDIFAGSYLLHRWLSTKLDIPHALPILLGVYFSLWMVSFMHFNILAATGKLVGVGRAYLIEGVLAVTLGTLLTYFAGATGMAAGLLIGTASVNFWFLSLQVWRHVINEHHPVNSPNESAV